MKTFLQLITEVYADLALATDIGNLQHLELELHPFTGLNAYGDARFLVNIPMSAPAFWAWGAQTLSIVIPEFATGNRTYLGESASVVEIAPLRYGGTLFDSPSDPLHQADFVHPMLRGDQIKRFRYPAQMADFHRWIITFCLCTTNIEGNEDESCVR